MKCYLMVLAAGMGSRYGGLKQIDPLRLGGAALPEYTVYDAIQAGIRDIVFIVRKEIRDEVADFFNERIGKHARLSYINQDLQDIPLSMDVPSDRAKPWGTVHAVYSAREQIDGPFIMVNSDDFYGRDAIQKLAQHLSTVDPQSADYSLVGYALEETLSKFGSVSRGICNIDDADQVTAIQEYKRIIREDDGALVNIDEDGKVQERFAPGQLASMNLFGFTPKFFADAEEDLKTFLSKEGKDLKSELYIPTVLNNRIKQGSARLQMIGRETEWFGVTYREDKVIVADRIQAMIDAGQYPADLWSS